MSEGRRGEMELSVSEGRRGEMELSVSAGRRGEMELSVSAGRRGEMELSVSAGRSLSSGDGGKGPRVVETAGPFLYCWLRPPPSLKCWLGGQSSRG